MTELYIGTKVIHAMAMTRQEYNDYRGWQLPDDEDGTDGGYLVEYVDGGKANDTRHKGYISWSPAYVFSRAYRPATNMSFGQALDAIKAGVAVARAGWNGKGMFLFLNKGSFDGGKLGFAPGDQPQSGHQSTIDGVKLDLFDAGDDGTVTQLPSINMRSASGSTVTGWLASQTDMLAEDWSALIPE